MMHALTKRRYFMKVRDMWIQAGVRDLLVYDKTYSIFFLHEPVARSWVCVRSMNQIALKVLGPLLIGVLESG